MTLKMDSSNKFKWNVMVFFSFGLEVIWCLFVDLNSVIIAGPEIWQKTFLVMSKKKKLKNKWRQGHS